MPLHNQWEHAVCPICKTPCSHNSAQALYTFGPSDIDAFQGSHNRQHPAHLRIVQCAGCGLHCLTPRPREEFMQKIYETPAYFEGGMAGGYDDYMGQGRTLEVTFRWFLRKLKQKGLTGGTLLDVGCGPGLFLKEARTHFEYTVGSDLCQEMAAKASQHCDLAVTGGPLSAKEQGPFDLITAIGVLEHVYDAVAFISECASLLGPCGHLVLVTPDIMGFWRKLMGRKWPSFKLPEHIAYYSHTTLKELACRASMTVQEFFPYHQAFPLNLVLKRLKITLNMAEKTKRIMVPIPHVMTTAVLYKI